MFGNGVGLVLCFFVVCSFFDFGGFVWCVFDLKNLILEFWICDDDFL